MRGDSRERSPPLSTFFRGCAARHWVRRTPEPLKELQRIVRRRKRARHGLTEKSKSILRQIDNPARRGDLLNFARHVLDDIRRRPTGTRGEALRMQIALTVELLTMPAIRRGNLVALNIDRHLRRTRSAFGDTVHLIIDGDEVKNGQDLAFELPADTVRLLDLYPRDHHPRLTTPGDRFLFPGRGGGAKAAYRLSEQIKASVHKETGLVVTTHSFRHIAVELTLEVNPTNHEGARQLLGHTSVKTAVQHLRRRGARRARPPLQRSGDPAAGDGAAGAAAEGPAVRGRRKLPFPPWPVAAWPERDRTAWRAARLADEPVEEPGLAAHWAPPTAAHVALCYGYWLAWLDAQGQLDPVPDPGGRAKGAGPRVHRLAAVRAGPPLGGDHRGAAARDAAGDGAGHRHRLAAHCRTPPADAGPADPEQDGAGARQRPARRRRHGADGRCPRGPLPEPADAGAVPPQRADDGAAGAAADARRQPGGPDARPASGDGRRPRARALRRGGGENRRPLAFTWPPAPVEALRTHLAVHRPALLDGSPTAQLWLGRLGPLTTAGCREAIQAAAEAMCGVVIPPHVFRDSAATTVALRAPEEAPIIASILGHTTPRTAERHDNQANSLLAARSLQERVQALRRGDDRRSEPVPEDEAW